MTTFSFEKAGSTGVLTLFGDLTAHRIGDLKNVLMLAVENADHLFLNLEKVRSIDAPCVRVLRAAVRKARTLGKGITLFSRRARHFRTIRYA